MRSTGLLMVLHMSWQCTSYQADCIQGCRWSVDVADVCCRSDPGMEEL